MSFSPRMQSEIHGFAVVGDLKWRIWNGVVADVWEVACHADAHGSYISPDPRLFVLLEMDGAGGFEIARSNDGLAERHPCPLSMSFVPADVETHGRAVGLTRMKHLDLHFSEASATRRFGRDLDRARLLEPRLLIVDPRMATLSSAIAEECANPSCLHDLYGESLVNALLTILFDVRPRQGRRRPGLSRSQLALVTEYIVARSFEPVRLGELSGLVGLSETYFSHAFKASTGVPPHRWQMQLRIRKVQEMLATGDDPLADVAISAGFADQAHFTRVFKTVTGVTPTEWRRRSHRRRR